ncbi:GDP-6-deoxy-D-lyxo-4-hexulose reductase [Brevibacillus brevis NBRC 100599]|uniref:GDP-6-deoxy-D-lyxo-4-hexulose reductase n=1 Tax=Brevibacillus brevis (strain 47 / JCM 6285 / NBRC 100599) TaxID=358681 RepID=C0ZAC2_BREBN|nr:GDP-mannose 4,6-dehydratase [Brevibacillus brevis]BAH42731.1 GDP-6-deoxy-D-lyxo-4-hexulose reductase [Brevibacillus brevis NBRC 100599]
MKALITGVTGFAGSHLAEYLLSRGDVDVYGTFRSLTKKEQLGNLIDRVHMENCELKDPQSVNELIQRIKPDLIFHLAAQSFVPTSLSSPADTMVNNIVPQLHLFEAVRNHAVACKIQIACSSEEYGLVYPEEIPIKETNPLRPLNPYAVSKIAQDYLGYQYHHSYGLAIIRTRTFHHTGPRRGESYVTSNFAKQIAQIELGLQEPKVHVGNLEAIRDFTDVRDIVKAYWLAITRGEPGDVYNISAGTRYTIEDMLKTLLALTDVQVEIHVDTNRLRPSDVDIVLGDSSLFREKTGWEPEISFQQTMEDLLNYWRSVLRQQISP